VQTIVRKIVWLCHSNVFLLTFCEPQMCTCALIFVLLRIVSHKFHRNLWKQTNQYKWVNIKERGRRGSNRDKRERKVSD